MMNRLSCAAVALSCLCYAAPCQVLRVPSQHKTIGAALGAASPGTTILVAPGTYTERITWPSVDGIRLISESGSASTTIDGAKGGTVLTFSSASVSRKTLVQGFTITGGFLNGTRNHGAGVAISAASPELRENRITGNTSDGTSYNYGGGIFIARGSKARIERNAIDGNELRNGSWNYGAGIYVDSSASPDVIANTIENNKNLSPAMRSGNRGHGAGIYVASTASPVLASNLISQNLNQVTSWNHGAGIAVTGSAIVVNNTLVANRCVGGSWTYGGGIYTSSSAQVVIVGNIVAGNSCSASSRVQGGGIYSARANTMLALDWNNVWNNTAGNYAGLAAGANDISKDPQFLSATDSRIAPASPCVDAMLATRLPSTVSIDMLGAPRRSDGNLDGLAGDGARLDIGAHEYSPCSLAVSGPAKLGTTLQFSVNATNRSLYVFLLDFQTGNLVVEPVGTLLLSPGFVTVAGGATPAQEPWILPNLKSLVGATTYHQALTLPIPSAGTAQLTKRISLTMF